MTVVVLLASHVFHLLAGTQRSEIACTEIEAGIVEDNYCSGMPKPDDKQKVCNEHLCPARSVQFYFNWFRPEFFFGLIYGIFLRERSGSVIECLTQDRGAVGLEPHRRHCVVVLEQDTFILA